MDFKKLTHLNAQYVAEMPLDDFVACVRDALTDCAWAGDANEDYFLQVAELMQSRTHVYDHSTQWRYFFSDDFEYEEKAVRKGLRKEGVRDALRDLMARLADGEFSEATIEAAIRASEAEAGIKEGKLNYPARVAVTGRATGAGIYETMALLGRERVLSRLDHAVERLCE